MELNFTEVTTFSDASCVQYKHNAMYGVDLHVTYTSKLTTKCNGDTIEHTVMK